MKPNTIEKMKQVGIVSYQLRDKNGNLKPLFQENALFRFLLKKNLISPFVSNSSLFKNFSFLFGSFVFTKTINNLIVTAGKALIVQRLGNIGAPNAITHIAVGTGVTAPAAGDTALGTELSTSGLSRAAATVTNITTTTTNDTMQAQVTFTASGSAAVTESGLFNAASAGTMLSRQTFSAVNVVSGDTLQVTWKIQAQ